MWRNRVLTILFGGAVLLAWQFLAAAPPAANGTKTKDDPTANDKAGKAEGKSAASVKKAPVPDESTPERVVKTDVEWRKILSPLQFRVTRKKWTEPAGTGKYAHTKADGIYHCVCCGEPLFDSRTKFESGTGWPSFFRVIDENAVTELEDLSEGIVRIEVQCTRCDAHLGHVFSDGPEPTGLRFCMNSASLRFVDRKKEHAAKDARTAHPKTAKKEHDGKADGKDKEPAKEAKGSE